MAVIPIWKDTIVSLGTADSLYFRISLTDTGQIIYSGKAFKRPGATYNEVRINDVCADWIVNVLPTLAQAEFTKITLPVSFNVLSSTNGLSWTKIGSYQFINDWSYDRFYVPETMGMSFPINGNFDQRMPLVYTGLNVSEVKSTIYFRGVADPGEVIIPLAISDDFNADYNADFSQSVRSAGSGTAVFDLLNWYNVDRVVIGNSTFRLTTDCGRFALYYVNAYGGWDFLLIDGNIKETDTITRHTREIIYDNRNVQNRGTENYVNEIVNSYSLVTGWLSDEEASRMHHLINSTDVYLYDINTKEMTPVVIPSTTCEYKTFKGQGNKLVNYTINVQVAQIRQRR